MSISIYTIKHPLVMNWESCLLQEKITNFEEFDLIQKLVLALIYEVSRKFIHVNQLYLQNVNSLEAISIVDNRFGYCIITNNYISNIAGKKILSLFPRSSMYIESINKSDMEDLCATYKIGMHNIKIVVIQEVLDSKIVTNVLNLMSQWHIAAENLQICCISCSSNVLENINSKCPNLNVYTIKLIDS